MTSASLLAIPLTEVHFRRSPVLPEIQHSRAMVIRLPERSWQGHCHTEGCVEETSGTLLTQHGTILLVSWCLIFFFEGCENVSRKSTEEVVGKKESLLFNKNESAACSYTELTVCPQFSL